MSKMSGRDHTNWTTNFDCIYCQNFSLKTKVILGKKKKIILYSSMRSISWRALLTSFLVRYFLKSCSVGRPTLKVLIAMSSKSSSISLNISLYLSEYVFRVSPSRMDMDNRESKGQGILLHVIKWDPNARVSSLKDLIESTPRPSNHLIATSPKLDGNTLHINVSFLECTTILWLKWLTCSTASVRLLYMVNVD